MVVVRSMEVNQKKTTLSFKQLDGVIRMMDPTTGQRTSLSHKCGELDKQIPNLLGVSKAILEHVVFCHQEDSSWPLMEGAVLKKRFDDIFDSTRYTKALDVFRKTEKEMNSKVKDLKAELAGLSSHQHAAKEYRKELTEQNEQLESLDDDKSAIKKTIDQCEEELKVYQEIIMQMEGINDEIEVRKNELTQQKCVVEKQREMLEEDLTNKHTVRELQEMLRDYDQKVESEKQRLKDLESDNSRLLNDIENLRKREMEYSSQIGKLSAEKDAHERRLRERFTVMENIAQKYSVNLQTSQTQDLNASFASLSATQTTVAGDASQDDSLVTSITPEDMQGFFQALDRKDEELKNNLKEHRERYQVQEDQLQSVLTELQGKLSSIESGE